MDITSIASQTATSNVQSGRSADNKSLSASDFLQLLVTEMTNQDPLDPMSDKEWMAQMAQFSSLEEMSSLNNTMSGYVQQQQAGSASAYLGRDVTILSAGGNRVEGTVTAVNSNNAEGKITVTVDGQEYDVKQIQSVRLANTDAS